MKPFDFFMFLLQLLAVGLNVYGFFRYLRLMRKTVAENKIINAKNEETVNNINERINLLSRENVKVRTENEMLKDRLRNMGIKDFDVL